MALHNEGLFLNNANSNMDWMTFLHLVALLPGTRALARIPQHWMKSWMAQQEALKTMLRHNHFWLHFSSQHLVVTLNLLLGKPLNLTVSCTHEMAQWGKNMALSLTQCSYTRIASLIIYKPWVAGDLFYVLYMSLPIKSMTISQTETWINCCTHLKCLSL